MPFRALKATPRRIWREIRMIAARERGHRLIIPTHALLFMTYRCTSRCRMCCMWERQAKAESVPEMADRHWESVIRSLADMKVRNVEFFGGDALLKKDLLIRLVALAHDLGLQTELPTNSILMDHETAERLVRAGLDVVWFSLDGVGCVHDEVRGVEGVSEQVDRAIAALRKARGAGQRPKLYLNTVVMRANADHFDRLVPYAEEAGVDGIDFEYVGSFPPASIDASAIGGLRPRPFFRSGDPVLLDEEQALRLKARIREIHRAPHRVKINTGKIDSLSVAEMASARYPNHRCYISRYLVTIDPYGNVVGCLHFNNFVMGNVCNEPLADIWKNDRHMEFLRAQGRGDLAICRYCSNGMQRNYTPLQYLRSGFSRVTGLART